MGASFAVGAQSHPVFQHVLCESTDGALLKTVDIGSGISNSVEQAPSSSVAAGNGVGTVAAPAVLGPLEAGPVKRLRVTDSESAISVAHDVDTASTTNTASKKAKKGGDENVTEELTLEQRLELLSGSISAAAAAKKSAKSITAPTTGTAATAATAAVVTVAPTSDSMVVLVDQALQSGDDALLEECLGCEDLHVVNATVARLSAARIVPLLKKLVSKFEKRPSRSSLLTLWLASILRVHSSFLMACPDLAGQLAGLSQILEQRLSSYSKLAALGGRLDLLMQQVTSNSNTAVAQAGLGAAGPARVFRDE